MARATTIGTTNKKRLAKAAGLAFVLFASMGCQKNPGNVALGSNYVGLRGANSVNSAVLNIPLKGTVTTDPSNQQGFQDAVTGLLTTDLPESSVGTVSCVAGQSTGVFFGGNVTLTGGSLANTSQWGTVGITPSSSLLIAVYHSNLATTGLPKLGFATASGYISGQQVAIEFSDSYGSIKMQGTYDANRFTGTMSYDNGIKYDGTRPGDAGTLGTFDIATCDFFRCN